MKIEATAGHYMLGQQRGRQGKENSIAPTPASPQEKPQPPQLEPFENPPASEAKAAGAIRNLQEGHYQGVASLRLQMNFHQQLQISSTQDATQMLSASSQTLVIGVEERVTTLRDDFADGFGSDFIEQANALMDTFQGTIENLFPGDTKASPQSIITNIQDAFGSFFSAFTGLEPLVPESEDYSAVNDIEHASALPQEKNADGVAVADESSSLPASPLEEMQPAESLSFADGLSELHEWFDEQLAGLHDSVAQLTSLPPIGEQRGNGVAYSRFMAIYNEMNISDTSSDDSGSSSPDGISTEA